MPLSQKTPTRDSPKSPLGSLFQDSLSSFFFFFRVKEDLSREEIHSIDRVGAILEGKRGPGYGVVDKAISKKQIYSERDTPTNRVWAIAEDECPDSLSLWPLTSLKFLLVHLKVFDEPTSLNYSILFL